MLAVDLQFWYPTDRLQEGYNVRTVWGFLSVLLLVGCGDTGVIQSTDGSVSIDTIEDVTGALDTGAQDTQAADMNVADTAP